MQNSDHGRIFQLFLFLGFRGMVDWRTQNIQRSIEHVKVLINYCQKEFVHRATFGLREDLRTLLNTVRVDWQTSLHHCWRIGSTIQFQVLSVSMTKASSWPKRWPDNAGKNLGLEAWSSEDTFFGNWLAGHIWGGLSASKNDHEKIYKARTRYNYTLTVWVLEISRSRRVYRVWNPSRNQQRKWLIVNP